MKPFDLQKALAGEPVVLRNGLKAYIKYSMLDHTELNLNIRYPLRGFFINGVNEACDYRWTVDGLNILERESGTDIIGMWEEPSPRVQLDLPCPLRKPQEYMWYIDSVCEKVLPSIRNSTIELTMFNQFVYFASEEDAQEWLNAMRDSRQ